MTATLDCHLCTLDNTYPEGNNFVCADCGREWLISGAAEPDRDTEKAVKDVNGNALFDGDAVVLIRDLKVRGLSITLRKGTRVESIRLAGDDHEVGCRMDAGSFMLKACFLRKVQSTP